jgi:membrane associated rhomboid family serine protease
MRLFSTTPPVVKNLIILNVAMLVVTALAAHVFDSDFMTEHLAMFYPGSPFFEPYQLLTHMFMHAGIWHLAFNMYALWLFGTSLEYQWGGKKFLLFYLVTGIGAAVFYSGVLWLQAAQLEAQIDPDTLVQMKRLLLDGQVLRNGTPAMQQWQTLMCTPMVGASGAVYGVLLGFGMLFPNMVLRFIFPPVALKAKWVVVIYGALELFFGLSNSGGNVAHFAHIGGMLFGFILIRYWKRKGRLYY